MISKESTLGEFCLRWPEAVMVASKDGPFFPISPLSPGFFLSYSFQVILCLKGSGLQFFFLHSYH